MIKVGDYITLKNNVPDSIKTEKIIYPIEVKSISGCTYHGCDEPCTECPGYINNTVCFGRDWGFIVKPINKDWDE